MIVFLLLSAVNVAIAGLACSAAIGLFGFHALRVARSAMDN